MVDLARAGLVALTFALAGCFGDDDPSHGPEETAHAWVAAINTADYERACELSVVDDQAECVELLKQEPFGKRIRVEDLESDSFDVELHDDEYLVHWEISIIR